MEQLVEQIVEGVLQAIAENDPAAARKAVAPIKRDPTGDLKTAVKNSLTDEENAAFKVLVAKPQNSSEPGAESEPQTPFDS